jgi:ABC-type multidrug transport system ATPase subunit
MIMAAPLLVLDGVEKAYTRGFLNKQVTFRIRADLTFGQSAIVGMMGPNGAGKTTLFEMMTGSNVPTSGRVLCSGKDIHQVKYRERDRLAIHYHQSYQVRHFRRRKPSFMLEAAGSDYPLVHLFDEPQFNTQDGYIGFMLDFFRKLRSENRLVFICLHPTAKYHLDILKEVCERFVFVAGGEAKEAASLDALKEDARFRSYLGDLLAVA